MITTEVETRGHFANALRPVRNFFSNPYNYGLPGMAAMLLGVFSILGNEGLIDQEAQRTYPSRVSVEDLGYARGIVEIADGEIVRQISLGTITIEVPNLLGFQQEELQHAAGIVHEERVRSLNVDQLKVKLRAERSLQWNPKATLGNILAGVAGAGFIAYMIGCLRVGSYRKSNQ